MAVTLLHDGCSYEPERVVKHFMSGLEYLNVVRIKLLILLSNKSCDYCFSEWVHSAIWKGNNTSLTSRYWVASY